MRGADYATRSTERTNRRNGYRHRDLDTRVGTLDVAVPKLREGSFFHPADGQARHRAGHHRPVEVAGLDDGHELDEQVESFRTRPLDAGPYTFVAADALVLKVREGGRVVKVSALVATGINAEGYLEIPVATGETGASWLGFSRDLLDRGLLDRGLTDAGPVGRVTSDAGA